MHATDILFAQRAALETTVVTALGWSIRFISHNALLVRITSRATLMPPPVDPAQAPMNISITKMALENAGQALKSTVA